MIIIINIINIVKLKYKAQTPKIKPEIKCNTFWRHILLIYVMKVPVPSPILEMRGKHNKGL
jgi:hypothetical protein